MKYPRKIKNFLKHEKQLNINTYKKAQKMLNEIIKFLIKWNIKKIYLYGSILYKSEFNYNSDIDIAIQGISSKKFAKLWFEIGIKFPIKIDLINLDDCDEYFKNIIKQRGKLIYEQ